MYLDMFDTFVSPDWKVSYKFIDLAQNILYEAMELHGLLCIICLE